MLPLFPWDRPAPLTRVWCCLELMYAIQLQKPLDLMPGDDYIAAAK